MWDEARDKIEILKKNPWLSCEFVIVPHNLNLLNLVESIIWLKEVTEYDERFKIGFSWLNGAPWYKIDNSPNWVREKVVAELESIILVDYTDQEQEQINELIRILKTTQLPSDLSMLKSHVEMTDTYRGSNTWDVIGWHYDEIMA